MTIKIPLVYMIIHRNVGIQCKKLKFVIKIAPLKGLLL